RCETRPLVSATARRGAYSFNISNGKSGMISLIFCGVNPRARACRPASLAMVAKLSRRPVSGRIVTATLSSGRTCAFAAHSRGSSLPLTPLLVTVFMVMNIGLVAPRYNERPLHLQQQALGVLDAFLDADEEGHRLAAVDD